MLRLEQQPSTGWPQHRLLARMWRQAAPLAPPKAHPDWEPYGACHAKPGETGRWVSAARRLGVFGGATAGAAGQLGYGSSSRRCQPASTRPGDPAARIPGVCRIAIRHSSHNSRYGIPWGGGVWQRNQLVAAKTNARVVGKKLAHARCPAVAGVPRLVAAKAGNIGSERLPLACMRLATALTRQ